MGATTDKIKGASNEAMGAGKQSGEKEIPAGPKAAPSRGRGTPSALWSSDVRSLRQPPIPVSIGNFTRERKVTRQEGGQMTEVLSALIPSAVVAAAVVWAVLKLVRSDAAGLRTRPQDRDKRSDNSGS